jgi:alpha-methylacyl-CoA racemase
MAVGAMEPKFYTHLLEGLGLDPSSVPQQYDAQAWPEMIHRFAKVFKGKTRDEWADVFSGKDACVTPILELSEVGEHPHNRERDLLVSVCGLLRPAPAPRLSRTPGIAAGTRTGKDPDSREVLRTLGYSDEEVMALQDQRIIG